MKHVTKYEAGFTVVKQMLWVAALSLLALFAIDALAGIPTVQNSNTANNGDVLSTGKNYIKIAVEIAAWGISAVALVVAGWQCITPIVDWVNGRKTWGDVGAVILTWLGVLVVVFILATIAVSVFGGSGTTTP